MIPLTEARDYVLSVATALDPVQIPVSKALGCVLAEPIVSDEAIPPFANTAMDGFAVRADDVVDAPCLLDIVGTVAAGPAPDVRVGTGQAARIMTGAVIPPGADAVVMVELTEVDGDRVNIRHAVPVGNHIRPAGDDIESGDAVFSPGAVLSAGHLGVLCSLGRRTVLAYPRARIGVFSTGDELVEDDRPLVPGEIRDSNRRTLLSLVHLAGAEPVDLGLVRDDEQAIETALRHGAASCDALLTSGGVSMGDFDFVKTVLSRIGEMRWMQIAIKPAKPFAFGTVDGTPIFGLPGNPVSSMVSFELFARPGLRAMMGHTNPLRQPVLGVTDEDLHRIVDGKTHFVRTISSIGDDGRVHVRSSGGQGSHMLWSMARSNALAVVPDGEGVLTGEDVDVLLLD